MPLAFAFAQKSCAAPAVAARLQDSEAKVVITADGSLRRGTTIAMKPAVDEALTELTVELD